MRLLVWLSYQDSLPPPGGGITAPKPASIYQAALWKLARLFGRIAD